ncbi:MAG TPA: hypothetical protein EYQ14_07235 [Gammaproteobacteria bacterium]|nr:hypothetical protein [Gammaproteobacteria bacterium]
MGTDYARRAGYDIIGKDGQKLSDKWSDGMKTFRGLQTHGFPNCFLINTQQGGFSVNFPHLLDEISVHLAYIISHALGNNIKTIEASEQAEKEWVEGIIGSSGSARQTGGEGCTPGFYNNEGKPDSKSRYGAFYRGGSIKYWQLLAEWREDGKFEGLEFGA